MDQAELDEVERKRYRAFDPKDNKKLPDEDRPQLWSGRGFREDLVRMVEIAGREIGHAKSGIKYSVLDGKVYEIYPDQGPVWVWDYFVFCHILRFEAGRPEDEKQLSPFLPFNGFHLGHRPS